MKNLIVKTIQALFCITVVMAVILLLSPIYIRINTTGDIYISAEEAPSGHTCLVLGASVWGDKPSSMLEDRLSTAYSLYDQGKVKQFLLSGDHSSKYYNEVKVMQKYLLSQGVDSSDIFMDHTGYSTYHSVTNAREIYHVDTLTIVTQEYHLPRAIYLAKQLGIKGYGVAAEDIDYPGMAQFKQREYFAQIKAFMEGIVKPVPPITE